MRATTDSRNLVRFNPQPEGGYGVEASRARTAFDVLADPLTRLRYGFVTDFSAGRDPRAFADNLRRLHLNAVQFYDWMYRHADLVPPEDAFEDPLGRPLSLETIRRFAAAARAAGSLPLAYAAVYAVGRDEWPRWRDAGLYRADGRPWTLGEDFLWIVDPTDERWAGHLATDLRRTVAEVGFAGFHLDQYGAPKRALREDGTEIDLAMAFPALIERLAAKVSGSRLIFNNVNDFPTWSTAQAPQDAVYVEVWPPHDRLRHLAGLIDQARLLAPEKPVVLAAYLSVYADADDEAAEAAERILLATAFSRGATCLLHGEEGAVLTEAYYVRHRRLDPSRLAGARAYFDFAVRYGDLLFDRTTVDVTRTELGGINEEICVEAPVPASADPEPGTLWVRATRGARGIVLSLIDLSAQTDDRWDAPRSTGSRLAGVRISFERSGALPDIFAADPQESPALRPLTVTADGRYDIVELPPFSTWALIWAREAAPQLPPGTGSGKIPGRNSV